MNKVLVGLVMVGSLAISGMAAEKSGAYAGVDLGVSMMKVSYTDLENILPSSSASATGLTYGLKGGYKHFLNDNFGVRGYVYLSNASSTPKLDFEGTKVNVKLSNMNYGVGADALYNFMDNFGAFAGISLGATSYSVTPDMIGYNKATSTGFNAAVNLGVRTVLADMHGIELGVSVPVGSLTVEYTDETGNVIDKYKSNTQAEVKVSYVFNF